MDATFPLVSLNCSLTVMSKKEGVKICETDRKGIEHCRTLSTGDGNGKTMHANRIITINQCLASSLWCALASDLCIGSHEQRFSFSGGDGGMFLCEGPLWTQDLPTTQL